MAAPVSIGTMLERLHGLEDTTDLTDWQNGFVKKMWRISLGGKRTSGLTEKQVETVEEIFNRHFAG